ncbi:MAG: adenylosuccinate lyase [Candidatus Omnitrophica bacterium]|nr:adenylosuccinate lyase [Candidatus Omnitrophota bacterium]
MIPRYTPPDIGRIWTEEYRFQKMLEVELLACEALSRLGIVPAAAVRRIRRKAKLDVQRIGKREGRTRHDVVAFLEELAHHVGPDAQYLHLGLTSSDALDTATGVQLKESVAILLRDLEKLRRAVRRKAIRYKQTVCMGRTHGVHAEPTTWGLKLAVSYAELTRALRLLSDAGKQVSVGKISGAVGTYAHLNPAVEKYICRKLGLTPAPISTQVVPRDGYAVFLCAVAAVGGMLERFATEIRHLQRTEVLEAEEPFGQGQTGSSAMPHKRNPVACERVSGLARLLRGYGVASLENIALWHERDITHSSVERVILPDAVIVLDYMLLEMTRVVQGMKVYPQRMRSNVGLTRGLIFSESVLLALMKKGLTRVEAYKIVQRNALAAWKGGADFQTRLRADRDVSTRLSRRELEGCFDLKRHTKHVNFIFRRVGLS